ncbi:MAG: DegT/DnrJ/EryC1/StrS aminotransferase family protein [Leptospirales bacterium]|nr:DegT/DnrJ/EryC1/StrS aminotransferase family protein [Leptospirales bacterium]
MESESLRINVSADSLPEITPPAPAGASPSPLGRLRRRKLHFARPDIGREEIQAVTRVLRSGWLTSGPESIAFEEEFAQAVGAAQAIAVNSCTAALHLAAAAWEIGSQDAVIVPALTFTATAEVFEYSGALPLIVDVDRDSYLLEPEALRRYLQNSCEQVGELLLHRASGRRIRAVATVHFGGRVCDMQGLRRLCHQFNIKLIDDAAHAFPARSPEGMVGTLADATAFSFYATKNLTTGEGGMLTLRDPELAERIRRMRLHGIQGQTYGRKRWQYDVTEPGYKYNMNDIAAALGRVQLQRSEEMLQRRRAIADIYDRELRGLRGLGLMPRNPGSAEHLYTIEIGPEAPIARDRFVEEMYARNIAVSLHFIPLYRLSRYRENYGLHAEDFPNSESIYARIVSLPLYSAMSASDAGDVVFSIRQILG